MLSFTSNLNHFLVGYKEVLELATPQIAHNLVLMIMINNNDNMIANNVHCLFMLCALLAVKYLPFYLTLLSFPCITSFGTRREGTLIIPILQRDDQNSMRLSNMLMIIHW